MNKGMAIALLLGSVNSAQANIRWLVTPSVEIRSSYEENVQLAADREIETASASAEANIALTGTSRRTVTSIVGGLRESAYTADDLKESGAKYLRLSSAAKWQRSQFQLEADATEDTLLRADSAFLADGLGDELEAGDGRNDTRDVDNLTGESQRVRQRWRVAPLLVVDLTSTFGAQIEYEYVDKSYDGSGSATGIQDIKYSRVGLSGLYRSSSKTSFTLAVNSLKLIPDLSPETDIRSVMLSWQHNPSDTSSFGIGLGMSELDSKIIGRNRQLIAEGRYRKEFRKAVVSVTLRQDSSPTSFGVVSDLRLARTVLGYAISRRWKSVSRLSWSDHKFDKRETIVERNEEYLEFEQAFQFQLSKKSQLTFGYRYRQVDADRQNASNASGNAIFVGVNWRGDSR